MAKNRMTGKKAGHIASSLLRNSNTSSRVKTVAASDLSQRAPKKRK